MQNEITKDTQISMLDAYNAMIKTIEKYNKFLQSDDINGLLSAMSLTTFADGGSADPAVWHDWEYAIKRTLQEKQRTK